MLRYKHYFVNKYSGILIIILVLAAVSCTEKVDIDLNSPDFERLVVYGYITTDTTTHTVSLTKTTDYFHNTAPPTVSNAIVEISDDGGNVHILNEFPQGSGIYETAPDYYADTGKTYTISINLQEKIGGYKFYTASSRVPPINDIDTITLEFHEDWGSEGYFEVQCYYQDPPTENFYIFNIYKNGELLTDTLSEKIVVDDIMYNGNYTNGIGVGYLDQAVTKEKLYPGDVITFQAGSITKEYANFVWDVQEEVSFSTPLFSGPPANVKGNINNGAIGFFAAYSTAYASTVYQ